MHDFEGKHWASCLFAVLNGNCFCARSCTMTLKQEPKKSCLKRLCLTYTDMPSYSEERSNFFFFLLLLRFLASLQRLNVTITRAKYSLFILGHLRTLMVGTF